MGHTPCQPDRKIQDLILQILLLKKKTANNLKLASILVKLCLWVLQVSSVNFGSTWFYLLTFWNFIDTLCTYKIINSKCIEFISSRANN